MRNAATSTAVEIPGYSVERLLGRGGMSSVYLGVQRSLGRRVALKVLKRFDNPGQTNRFLHEGRIIAALNHRNIITIHDIGTIGERHYIAMEYLRGRSLAERIAKGVPLPKALSLLEQLAACLHFVHKRGIVHRDIKPGNIMFHADGTPKLTDFGIAKRVHSNQELTLQGSALGSPYYLSPEQAEGLPVDGRTDVYALGIVFYEMLTGERPYAGETPLETVMAHLTAPLPVLPGHLAQYQGLIDAMLAKQPDDRVGSAKELVHLVRQAKSQKSDLLPVTLSSPQETGYVRPRYRLNLRRPQITRRRMAPWFTLAVAAVAFAAVLLLGDRAGTGAQQTPGTGPTVQVHGPGLTTMVQPVSATRDSAARATLPVRETSASRATESLGEGQTPSREAIPITAPAPDRPKDPPVQATEQATQQADAQIASNTWGPTETAAVPATDDPSPPDEIIQSMLAASQAMDTLRLTLPPDDNARLHYRRVLALRPDHAGAKAGIAAIAQRYAEMAERSLEQGRTTTAATYVRRGLGVESEHPALLLLQQAIIARQAEAEAVTAVNDAPVPAVPTAPPPQPPEPESIVGTPGTGDIVGDFKRVWRAVFN